MTQVTDPALLAQLNAGSQPAAPAAVQDPAVLAQLNGGGKSYTGTFLPYMRDEQGLHWAVPKALEGLIGGATLPGDVYAGKVDPRSDEAFQRTQELAAAASPISPATNAAKILPGIAASARKAAVPTQEELAAAAKQGFNGARDLDVAYNAAPVSDLANALRQRMEGDGIYAELAPKTFSALDKLSNPPPDAFVPYAGIDAARKFAKRAGQDFTNPTEQLAGRRLIDGLDEFVQSAPDTPGVLRSPATQGDAARAAELSGEARANYAAGKRSEAISDVQDAADLRSAGANSGQNVGNATRARIASLLLAPKRIAGYSPEERAALEGVVRGTAAQNMTRRLANVLGGGGGLGAAVTGGLGALAGGAQGGVQGATIGAVAAPLAGALLKAGEGAMARRSVTKADELIRKRSPLYGQRLDEAQRLGATPSGQAALARALMFPQSDSQ